MNTVNPELFMSIQLFTLFMNIHENCMHENFKYDELFCYKFPQQNTNFFPWNQNLQIHKSLHTCHFLGSVDQILYS